MRIDGLYKSVSQMDRAELFALARTTSENRRPKPQARRTSSASKSTRKKRDKLGQLNLEDINRLLDAMGEEDD